MSTEPISTEDVRGAVVLSMEGFWHPDAGADFDRWHAWTRAQARAELAWDQVAECHWEDRTHGHLCTCYGPLTDDPAVIRTNYIESFVERECGSSSTGDGNATE